MTEATIKRDWRKVRRFRNKEYNLRLSAEEHEQLFTLAAQKGVTVGALIRQQVLGSEIPKNCYRIPQSSLKPELAKLLAHLGKVGSNLNQVARVYNSRNTPTPAALHATLKQLQLVVHDVRTALKTNLKDGDC